MQVLAHEHEAVLSSMEHLASTGSLSTATSVYFSPPESIEDLAEVGLMDDGRSLQSMFSTEETPDATIQPETGNTLITVS